jgi:hypothetical protein
MRNLIPFAPPGCFSDVTVALNLISGFIKEVMDSRLTLVHWEARGKLIWIGHGKTVGEVKGVQPESLAPRKGARPLLI